MRNEGFERDMEIPEKHRPSHYMTPLPGCDLGNSTGSGGRTEVPK